MIIGDRLFFYMDAFAGIDDIRSSKKLEAIAVQFFNGFSHCTLSKGVQVPRTSILVTANQPFSDQERLYLANIVTNYAMIKIILNLLFALQEFSADHSYPFS